MANLLQVGIKKFQIPGIFNTRVNTKNTRSVDDFLSIFKHGWKIIIQLVKSAGPYRQQSRLEKRVIIVS